MREAFAAGLFYPKEKNKLLISIKDSFEHKLGPNKSKASCYAKGFIIPHAGYVFSGPCAAHAFKQIRATDIKTFLILGFSHRGSGNAALSISKEDWQTPLGIAKNNIDLGKEFIKHTDAIIDEQSHQMEHSIEVMLPILQYVSSDFTFVPINVSGNCDFKELGEKIAQIIKSKKVIVIASSDFTHYGNNFGYTPFDDAKKYNSNSKIKEKIKKLDMGAIEHILNINSVEFRKYIAKTGATICGINTISLIIEIMKNLGNTKTKLLKYYTSAEITQDDEHSVSYASISFS